MSNNQFVEGYPQQTEPFDQTEIMMGGPGYPIRPISQNEINQGIAQGFGQFFFNAHDPNIAKTNVPIKQQSQKHIAILVGTIIMVGGIIAGAIIVQRPSMLGGAIALLIVPYLIYLIVSICMSQIRGYITNLKKFDDYKQIYDKMVIGRGYFHFYIECYHYKNVKTKNGYRRQKVVTHTASQKYYPAQSVDQSGNVTGIKDITKYVFIKYLKRFYFTDKTSEQNFNRAYKYFIHRNTKDMYQSPSHTFDIQGLEEQVGFCMLGESPHNSIVFYLLTFLGLALPYSCILERSVSRYSINMLKRLTCQK